MIQERGLARFEEPKLPALDHCHGALAPSFLG